MKLDALFQNPTALPTAPKVVEELISSFDKASVSTEEIAKKLSTDPVLSAKLLRLANSATTTCRAASARWKMPC
jgi:HD-like signal output (HDOD) protein